MATDVGSVARDGGPPPLPATDTPTRIRTGDWPSLLEVAESIVQSYDTPVTLRQLFYRLVAAELLPNTTNAYKALSRHTAEARRDGAFPALMDRTRRIHRYETFSGAEAARQWLARIYRRDRTAGQPVSLYLGVEKAGIVEQLRAGFGELGIPVLALGGYGSQTYVDEVRADVLANDRPAVLLYAGDHDPSGEDIDRDFVERTACWASVRRVALSAEQVEGYQLPPGPGKLTDSRASSFTARHGRLVQVELDALPPDVLGALFTAAISEYWSEDPYREAVERERADIAELTAGTESQ